MKSIEEAANEIIGNQGKRGFKAGVEFAQRWIPVEEEKPSVANIRGSLGGLSIRILIKYTDNTISLGYYSFFSGKFVDFSEGCHLPVTHWRPIELK